jgi:hypothetical protein
MHLDTLDMAESISGIFKVLDIQQHTPLPYVPSMCNRILSNDL